MALLILISFAIIPLISSSGGGVTTNQNPPQIFGWHDNQGYHYVMYAQNQFGQGVAGYRVSLNMSLGTESFSGGETTNSTGFAKFTIQAAENPNYTVTASISLPGGFGTIGFGSGNPFSGFQNGSTVSIPDGQIVGINSGPGLINTVTDPKNSSINDPSLFLLAPYGAPPSGYSVYYKFFNSTSVSFNVFYNQSQMQVLGTLNGFVTRFSPPALPSGAVSDSNFVFEIFYPNGTIFSRFPQIIPVNELYPPPAPPIHPTTLAAQFFAGIFSLFIPLMAIIGAYTSYGKDRVTGVLESIITRPVTRRGLSISRYLSTFLAMAVAVGVAVIVVDVIVDYYAHSFIDSVFLLPSTGAFLVELAAFIGIMLFLAHLVKGSGALIGIGIALFIVFDFFWGLLILGLAALLGAGFGTIAYNQITTVMQFINPAQFVSLVSVYITGQSSFGLITPSDYGITIPSLVATAALWIGVPFGIFLYLATKRD